LHNDVPVDELDEDNEEDNDEEVKNLYNVFAKKERRKSTRNQGINHSGVPKP